MRAVEQVRALSPTRLRLSCKLPKRAHSRATFRTIALRNNHRSSPASRRFPSSTTKMLAAKAPANTLLKSFSADARKHTYILPSEIFKHICTGGIRAESGSLAVHMSAHSCQRSLPANNGSESETGMVFTSENFSLNNSRTFSGLKG
jgi:hypothetical protein